MKEIVSMIEYRGRIIVATPDAVYDMTDPKKPVVLSTAQALNQMMLGKKYEMVELPE